MNRLFASHMFFRGSFFQAHMVTIIGVMLCFYFSYHTFFGHRSVLSLVHLNSQIESTVSHLNTVLSERQILERNVVSMRPDSLNPDMVEERARAVLGYTRVDEVQVLSN